MPLSRVQEIIRMVPVLKIPRSPDFVEGVIDLRGKVIPVIDLKKRFFLQSAGWPPQARIIIAELGALKVGLMVDAVFEVARIDESAYEDMPQIASPVHHRFIHGIAKHRGALVIILDLENLLTMEEVEEIKAMGPDDHA